jgi:hypothetical protein
VNTRLETKQQQRNINTKTPTTKEKQFTKETKERLPSGGRKQFGSYHKKS